MFPHPSDFGNIPYARQDINQSDIDAVAETLRSPWLTQGPAIPRFEEAVGKYVGVRHAVAVSSATAALHIACRALAIGPGDWLWTSPNTFVASANCGVYCGARIDFVDIDSRTYNLSVECLKEKLVLAKKENRLPKVVVPVHFAGQSCEMEAIHGLSKEYGFRILEDGSHAIGGTYQGMKVGDCRLSDITVFSFHPVKIITTAEGGMALTNNPELAERMSRLRTHGITSKPERMLSRPAGEVWNYQQVELGYHYRMTDLQAALGLSQLARLDSFVSRRRQIAENYDQALSSKLIFPWQHPDCRSSYHLYVIRIRKSQCGKTQQEVMEALGKARVGTNLHYIPVYRQPFYEKMGFRSGYCSEAENYFREAVSIPMYPALSDGQQKHVINSLRDILD